jgi:GT2 family glycosyltransferase
VTVAVIIVNWNAGDYLRRCLESLAAQRRRPDRIVVVDNASTDGSLDSAAPWLGGSLVIRLQENQGFAKANNVAAQASKDVDALAMLNPDAFAHSDWLAELVAAAERAPDVACFASHMRFDSNPRYVDGAGDSYHASGRAWRNGHGTLAESWEGSGVEVFAPSAAAALYRRTAFEEAGGFDESYFCYLEDVDLGFRMRLKGHRCEYVPTAIVNHVSSGVAGYRSNFAVYHGERNMVWTYFKDMPGALFWQYLPQHLLLNLISLFFYPFRGQGRVVWRAKWDALKGLPNILQQRRVVQASRVVPDRALRDVFRRGLLTPYLRRYT